MAKKAKINGGLLIISSIAMFLGVSGILSQASPLMLALDAGLMVSAAGILLTQSWARKVYFTVSGVYIFLRLIFLWFAAYRSQIIVDSQGIDLSFLPYAKLIVSAEILFLLFSIRHLCKPNVKELFK